MMKQHSEALRLAEAIEQLSDLVKTCNEEAAMELRRLHEVTKALHEPVATLDHNGNFELLRMVGVTVGQSIKLYEHPAPRKPFVRLSEEECISIHRKWVDSGRSISRFARAIEDALEEKNR